MRKYPLATACPWIGNRPEVAAKHYATSVDLNAAFRKATGGEIPENDTTPKAAQNPAPPPAESNRMDSHPCDETRYLQGNAKNCDLPPRGNGPEWSRTIDLVVISDAL
jgi:hypothetical protein